MTGPTNAPGDRLASLRIDRSGDPAPRRGRAVLLLLLGAALIGGALAAWRFGPWSLPAVETARARVESGLGPAAVLTATGYVVADREASISPKVTGRLVWLGPREGDAVREGEVIARLDDREARASLDSARARLEEERLNLDRIRRLFADGIVQKASLDGAEASFKVAQADVAYAATMLDNMVIRAPFDGVVIQRYSEVGETVSPGFSTRTTQTSAGAIYHVSDPVSYEVEADVSEASLTKVSVGQSAEIALDAYPGEKLRGRLRHIDPTADRQKAIVQVKVTFDHPDTRVLPQMAATVTFLSAAPAPGEPGAGPARVFVPKEAVREGRVLVVENDLVRERSVKTGEEGPAGVEILSGVRGGEEVVVKGPGSLREGTKIRRAGR